ncbi:hypothetical protein SLS55_006796 [Diplodia seriata]|uniref:Uncharacterized protein n=1 Tax=Diplodia seriata TaxID=420778 RepID=A0ABR3CAK5_9PEZI
MDQIPLRNMDEEQSLQDEDELPPQNFRNFLYAQAQGITVALLSCLCLGLPIIIGVLPNLSAVGFKTCMDGNFRVSTITSPWDPRTIFAISLGFGSLDFAVAKGIDIAFDLIVGRGGQLLFGLIAYPVFTDVLLYSMETQSATYAYYAAVAFDTVSVSTMTQISKDLCQRPKANRNLRIILVTTGLLLTSLYIVSFPTLASAATGYTTLQDAVYRYSTTKVRRQRVTRQ